MLLAFLGVGCQVNSPRNGFEAAVAEVAKQGTGMSLAKPRSSDIVRVEKGDARYTKVLDYLAGAEVQSKSAKTIVKIENGQVVTGVVSVPYATASVLGFKLADGTNVIFYPASDVIWYEDGSGIYKISLSAEFRGYLDDLLQPS
jgi:hypothetical protein